MSGGRSIHSVQYTPRLLPTTSTSNGARRQLCDLQQIIVFKIVVYIVSDFLKIVLYIKGAGGSIVHSAHFECFHSLLDLRPLWEFSSH